MALERFSPVPLYVQIEEAVRERIESGELGPLAQVPSETDLAETMGVSRMTARKALDRLVTEGVLFRRAGKGTFVSQPKIAHGLSTQLSFSAGMDALGLTHTTRVLQAAMAPASEHVARMLNIAPGAPTVLIRRLRIVEGAPAALHNANLPSRFAGLLDEELTGSLTKLMTAYGARVANSHDSVEAVSANPEEASVLEVAERSPLLRVEGVAHSEQLDPLRYTHALYPAHRFRLSVDTSQPADLKFELKWG